MGPGFACAGNDEWLWAVNSMYLRVATFHTHMDLSRIPRLHNVTPITHAEVGPWAQRSVRCMRETRLCLCEEHCVLTDLK